MTDPINLLQRRIGAFFRARRESIPWTAGQLRDRAKINSVQIDKIEKATGPVTTDTFFRVMLELGIGLHLTEQNSDQAMDLSLEGAAAPPPFLTCTDGKQIYVLHWNRPAFLLQVIQTKPYTLRFVATYGPTPEQVKALPVWEEAQRFVRKQMRDGIPLN